MKASKTQFIIKCRTSSGTVTFKSLMGISNAVGFIPINFIYGFYGYFIISHMLYLCVHRCHTLVHVQCMTTSFFYINDNEEVLYFC